MKEEMRPRFGESDKLRDFVQVDNTHVKFSDKPAKLISSLIACNN